MWCRRCERRERCIVLLGKWIYWWKWLKVGGLGNRIHWWKWLRVDELSYNFWRIIFFCFITRFFVEGIIIICVGGFFFVICVLGREMIVVF